MTYMSCNLTLMGNERDGSTSPVRQVSVVSTGTVVIHPEHAARDRKPMY